MCSWDEFYQGSTVGAKCSYLNPDRIVPAGVVGDRIREIGPTRGSPAKDSSTLKSVRVL